MKRSFDNEIASLARNDRENGQTTVEYAVIIAVVVAALLGMQIYMKGGLSGKLRESADQVGEQFSPTAYKAKMRTTNTSASRETLYADGLKKGESKSDASVAIDGKTGIVRHRVGLGGAAGDETLTDDQKNDKLF